MHDEFFPILQLPIGATGYRVDVIDDDAVIEDALLVAVETLSIEHQADQIALTVGDETIYVGPTAEVRIRPRLPEGR